MARPLFNADPDDLWPELKAGLERLYARMPLNAMEYMRLYTCVRESTIELKSLELFLSMQRFLDTHVNGLAQRCINLEGEEKQVFYLTSWKQFEFASRVANAIFAYLNRHWIRSQLDAGHTSVMEIYPIISRALIPCMQLERLGQTVSDACSVKELLDCFVRLNRTSGAEERPYNPNRNDYRKALEHLLAISPTQYDHAGTPPYKPRSLVNSCKGVLIGQYLSLLDMRSQNACSDNRPRCRASKPATAVAAAE